MKLPVTVIVPTLNARPDLPRHVEAMVEWISDVEQVVVVDGESEDGSLEYLKTHLGHPNIEYYVRPRGLYDAWNFAVSRATGRFVYFATVGDRLQAGGLSRLLGIAEATNADAVLSPPVVLKDDGKRVSNPDWPIHRLLAFRQDKYPFLLSDEQQFILANAFGIQGMLGSSASNLYRASTLRDYPFPTDCGHAGDTAWGCRNSLRVRVAICPEPCAEFIHVREEGLLPDPECAQLELKFAGLAEAALVERLKRAAIEGEDLVALRVVSDGWLRARKWMMEQVEFVERLKACSAQQLAYIEDLKSDGQKRFEAIQALDAEVTRLRLGGKETFGRFLRRFWNGR